MGRLLAISGGLDSVCLLHFFKDDPDVFVAHFNHKTRPSADDDQEFVRNLARKYDKLFFTEDAEPGDCVSEEAARKARYDFLRSLAKELDADIYTAHHLDDALESIAINLLRGTGWRGLAPFGAKDIKRPFVTLQYDKRRLLEYAAENQLTFREDPTNHEDTFLRNRIRERLHDLPDETRKILYHMYWIQSCRRELIDEELFLALLFGRTYSRDLFRNLPDDVALEALRFACNKQDIRLTRPQLEDFLSAIRTYTPEKYFNLPNDRLILLHKDYFVLK